jgi:hypothetical protein
MVEESGTDRLFREAAENAVAEGARTQENRGFLGAALDRVVPTIRGEISAGLEQALGGAAREAPIHARLNRSTRAFGLRAQNPTHGSQATIIASLAGTGPEFTNADLVHYTLCVVLTLKHRAGVAPGQSHELRVRSNGLGEGRPSISADDVRRGIESEIEKRLTSGH